MLGFEAGVALRHHDWGDRVVGTNYDISYTDVGISAAAIWNFWFSDRFAAFGKLGLGFSFGTVSAPDGAGRAYANAGYGGLYLLSGAGILNRIGSVLLRAEVTNLSLGLGAGFAF